MMVYVHEVGQFLHRQFKIESGSREGKSVKIIVTDSSQSVKYNIWAGVVPGSYSTFTVRFQYNYFTLLAQKEGEQDCIYGFKKDFGAFYLDKSQCFTYNRKEKRHLMRLGNYSFISSFDAQSKLIQISQIYSQFRGAGFELNLAFSGVLDDH